ncbi:MAG: hypothetical protein JO288_14460 [Hyphomicrobiales bacterium]|nr:hypothetical protein [Hyphomicrobiales bacterium]
MGLVPTRRSSWVLAAAGALTSLAASAFTQASASVRHPDFFASYATQSGQNYHGRRPPWSVAGVDEPEGYREQYLPLLDPASLNGQQGCVYAENGPRLVCNNSAGVTIQGYDFSLHGGVFLQLASSDGPCTVEDNNFQWAAKNAYQPNYWVWFDSCASYDFSHNTLYGNPWALPTTWQAMVLVYGGKAPGTFEHNDVEWSNGRFVSFGSSGAYMLRYNYLEGMVYNGDLHGENEFAGAAHNIDIEYNTVLIPKAGTPANTASFAPFAHYNGRVASVTVANNTIVVNKSNGTLAKAANGSALYAQSPVAVGALTIANNWIDPSGAWFCNLFYGGATAETINEAGNVNLLDGSSVTGIHGLGQGEICHGHFAGRTEQRW